MEEKSELIAHLKELTENEDVFQARRELKHIFELFEKAKARKIEEQRQLFLDEIVELPEEERNRKVFIPEPDPLDDLFESTYREVRFALKEKEEQKRAEQQKIYERKLAIIDKIYELSREENIAKAFRGFNDLKEEWKNAGISTRVHEKELHEKHNLAVKEFYYNMNIYKQLKAYDFERNLKERRKIIEECRAIMNLDSIQKKRDRFYELQHKWHDAGPVSREKYEELQKEWHEIIDFFHDQLGEYYEKLHAEQDANLEKKKELVKRVADIDTSLLDTHAKWKKKTKKVIEIQKMWKTIGFARRKENEEVWKEFRQVCDRFFDAKKEFYDRLRVEQEENKNAKLALIEKADEMKDSTDWKATTQAFITLQQEWKKIPPAHHRDENRLWRTFREKCNYFFEQKKAHFAEENKQLLQNLELKKKLIEEMEAFEPGDDKNEVIEKLKSFSDRWNAIGYVPFKDKDEVNSKYQKLLNGFYGKIKLDEDEKLHILYQNKINHMLQSNDPLESLYNEKNYLKEKIDHLNSELIRFENNLSFINSNDEGFLNRLQKKVEHNRHNIELLQEKLKMVNIAIHKVS